MRKIFAKVHQKLDRSWQLKSGQRCSFSSFHWEVSVYFDECLTCFQANFTTSINPFPLLIDIFSKKRESIFLHPLIVWYLCISLSVFQLTNSKNFFCFSVLLKAFYLFCHRSWHEMKNIHSAVSSELFQRVVFVLQRFANKIFVLHILLIILWLFTSILMSYSLTTAKI